MYKKMRPDKDPYQEQFCHYCGDKFIPWDEFLPKYAYNKMCQSCFSDEKRKGKSGHYCKKCGASLIEKPYKTSSGFIVWSAAKYTICQSCKIDRTEILYECRCKHPKKHKHHFDYNRPNEVILLCPACHGAEHARLNKIKEKPKA